MVYHCVCALSTNGIAAFCLKMKSVNYVYAYINEIVHMYSSSENLHQESLKNASTSLHSGANVDLQSEIKRTQSLLDQALKNEQTTKSRNQRLEASMKRRKEAYERQVTKNVLVTCSSITLISLAYSMYGISLLFIMCSRGTCKELGCFTDTGWVYGTCLKYACNFA